MLVLLACSHGVAEAPPPAPPPVQAEPPAPVVSTCPVALDSPMGGYEGSPACVAGEARWSHVPPADRGCKQDGDCQLVSADSCFHLVVAASAAAAYEAEHPCVYPNAGMCPPPRLKAVCEAGCCVSAPG